MMFPRDTLDEINRHNVIRKDSEFFLTENEHGGQYKYFKGRCAYCMCCLAIIHIHTCIQNTVSREQPQGSSRGTASYTEQQRWPLNSGMYES